MPIFRAPPRPLSRPKIFRLPSRPRVPSPPKLRSPGRPRCGGCLSLNCIGCKKGVGGKTNETDELLASGSVHQESQLGPEESAWQPGGRYKVLRSVPVFEDPEGTNGSAAKMGDLRLKDLVLLLETRSVSREEGSKEVGLVMPSPPDEPGWIVLEEGPNAPIERRRQLEGSWEMRARYMVKSPATMREGPDMSSPEKGEVKPGEEVLVLELGVGKAPDHQSSRKLRLRMMIRTEAGNIGWISPETSTGERLLYPVNLLGPQVVELHRRSMNPGSSVAPRQSMRPGAQQLPWQAGAKYRVLEKVALRQELQLSSPEVGKISAGCIVAVSEVKTCFCPELGGMCPCARVVVDSGPEEGAEGWVRCSHKDGRDLIDSRDQLEVDKVVKQLRMSQAQGFHSGSIPLPRFTQGLAPPEMGQDAAEACRKDEDGFYNPNRPEGTQAEQQHRDNDSSTSGTRDQDDEGDKEMRLPQVPDAARRQCSDTEAETPGIVPRDKASRMFEEANEDRPLGEPTLVEEKTYNCCVCSVRRP